MSIFTPEHLEKLKVVIGASAHFKSMGELAQLATSMAAVESEINYTAVSPIEDMNDEPEPEPGDPAFKQPTGVVADTPKRARKAKGARKRSTPEAMQAWKDEAMAAAKSFAKKPFSRAELDAAMGSEVKTNVLTQLVHEGRLAKEGEKRNTRYTFVR
ncbi:MAG: hypothetical protein WC551_07495 [Patescibacteria group bacterium]